MRRGFSRKYSDFLFLKKKGQSDKVGNERRMCAATPLRVLPIRPIHQSSKGGSSISAALHFFLPTDFSRPAMTNEKVGPPETCATDRLTTRVADTHWARIVDISLAAAGSNICPTPAGDSSSSRFSANFHQQPHQVPNFEFARQNSPK